MAQWTFIDPNTLLPGDPWTSAKAQAAFENLEAVAEGAPGAPRLYGKAAVPRSQQDELEVLSLTASDDVALSNLHYAGGFSSTTTQSTSFQSAGIITSVLMSGTVRFRATQLASASQFGSTTCQIRILKNGSVAQTFSVSSSPESPASATRQINLSVSVGDTFEWQVRRSGGQSLNCRISSISERADDGYVRIGIPIRESDL